MRIRCLAPHFAHEYTKVQCQVDLLLVSTHWEMEMIHKARTLILNTSSDPQCISEKQPMICLSLNEQQEG